MGILFKARSVLTSLILMTTLLSLSAPANAFDFGGWRFGGYDFSRIRERFARIVDKRVSRIDEMKEARLDKEKARRAAENEARIAAEEAARVAAEEEARIAAEKAARVAAEEEARIAAEDAARIAAEEEARIAAEDAARVAAEEEARIAAEEAARVAAENEARIAAEEEAARLAVALADKNSVALNWTFPTVRTDGSYLAASEISGFEIYYYREGASEGEGSVVDVPALDADNNSVSDYIAADLSAGIYYFAIAAYDNDALYSDISSEVSVVIEP